VTIRALRSEDRERVARAVQQLGRQSIYFRLFSYRDELTETGLDRIMTFDADRDAALLVTTTVAGEEIVIGSGRYVRSDPTTAELAFLVAEDYYGRGIASRLLRHLAIVARDRGITTFEAEVLAENKAMYAVFARTGWSIQWRRDGGSLHVTLALPNYP
jgi:RimJ/RimL family protein N-acetyltransferase